MASLQEFTIHVDRDLAQRLAAGAKDRSMTPEALIAECVAQQLELAIRYRAVLDRLETVDEHIVTLAQFVGEATQDAGGIDLSRVCRYRREKDETK
jgi:predicted transcriptional regulator